MMRISDGSAVDHSWELVIYVTNLEVERTLRVTGDLHVGGLMFQLVESLDVAIDWSDHALWWPERRQWLLRTRDTLDACAVAADTRLKFTPTHKNLRVQIPDLQIVEVFVDFSCPVFETVMDLGNQLGIRHPEELSLLRMRNNGKGSHEKWKNSSKRDSNASSQGSRDNLQYDIHHHQSSPISVESLHDSIDGNGGTSLEFSPVPAKDVTKGMMKYKSCADRATVNAGWLDSCISLYEQDIGENDLLELKFKYFSFYDLDSKHDGIRINQLYEQARWSILSERVDTTEEEMVMFGALQLQVNLQSQVPQPTSNDEDDIDAALTDLQVSLEGHNRKSDITTIPELRANMKMLKPKKLTLKSFKQYHFVFRDTILATYRHEEDAPHNAMSQNNLKGGEVSADVNISLARYRIKVTVPSTNGISEFILLCESEEQYVDWMAAFRMATRGKTMADSSYESEKASLRSFLSMQHPSYTAIDTSKINIEAEDYVSPQMAKRHRSKETALRILEAHANVTKQNLIEAKLNYIRAWQALPTFGINHFVCKFRSAKKEELLGIAHDRLVKQDMSGQKVLQTWRYSMMKEWHVNWDAKEMCVQFTDGDVFFACLSAPVKVLHEYIGGYIFLSMRAKDKNEALDHSLFYKLTGGWA